MILTTPEQIKAMKEGGAILAGILRELGTMVHPGTRTQDLETRARERVAELGVEPSFLGYVVGGTAYPAALCVCVNDETVHATPSQRVLQDGDLLKLDFGIRHKGLHTDAAYTVLVSDHPSHKEHRNKMTLIRVTREALYAGIAAARAGNVVGDIGAAIQNVVEKKNGFTIVQELGGHGIGSELHESPWVGNFAGAPDADEKLVPGMALAIEPITSTGSWKIKNSADGFGYLTKDGSLSAHFEHTIIVTEKGPLIVTE